MESLALPLPDREKRLARWREKVTTGIIALEPGLDGEGRIVTRWGVRVNVAEPWLPGKANRD